MEAVPAPARRGRLRRRRPGDGGGRAGRPRLRLPGRELALTRSEEAQARIVTFANDHLTVDLELLADGRTIVGELQPAEAAAVELETVGQGRVTADEFGRFRLVSDATSLRIRVVGRLVTPWITR